jgi:hypothetical protein
MPGWSDAGQAKEFPLEAEESPKLLPLHPKALDDGEFSLYEAEFEHSKVRARISLLFAM